MAVEFDKTGMFSLKAKSLLFILLIILVLVLHYPMSFNEIGWDSFAIHVLANTISESGYAKWWLHPLSVIGSYPYSEISGALPFLLSGISQITGMSGDITIFWTSLFLGVLSIFTAYLMAGAIFNNEIYKFLVAFGYSTSQGILFYTTWTAGTRALFIILLPLFIYGLIKSYNSIRYVLLTAVLFLLLMSTHKMFYFLLPVILGFIAVQIIFKIRTYISVKQPVSFNYIFLSGLLGALLIPLLMHDLIGVNLVRTDSRDGLLNQFFETYVRYSGIAILFTISGYVYTLLNKNKTRGEYILLTSLIFLAPFIYIITYMKWFILPFLFLLSGRGLWNIMRTKQALKIVPVIIALIVIFSGYYQYIHFYEEPSSKGRDLDRPLYEAAMWSKDHISPGYKAISSRPVPAERFSAISQVPTMTGLESIDLAYGFVNKDGINIVRSSLKSLDVFFESPYRSTEKPKTDWFLDNTFLDGALGEGRVAGVIKRFDLSYFIEHLQYGRSRFSSSVYEKNERYYDNGKIRVWNLRE